MGTGGLTSLSGSTAVVALRLEGPDPSVKFRRERLLAELGLDCEASSLDEEASVAFWRAIRDVLPLAGPGDRAIWRISVAPSRGGEMGEAIGHRLHTRWYLHWAGGVVLGAIAGSHHVR